MAEKTLLQIINDNPWILGLEAPAAATVIRGMCAQRNDGLSDSLTLCDFYDQWYMPNVSETEGVSAGTIKKRNEAFRYYKRLTGDPPLKEISQEFVNKFVCELRKQEWNGKVISDQTVRKHCNAISAVLKMACKPDYKHPQAKSIIDVIIHWPVRKREKDVTDKTPELEEYQQIVMATADAPVSYPHVPGTTQNQWWQSAYTVLGNTGIRKNDLLTLRWSDIKKVNGYYCLVVRSGNEKEKMEKPIPLNPAAIEALNQMPRGGKDELIFPFDGCEATFTRCRQVILDHAGVQRKRGTFHAIRRMVGTLVDDATFVLGHTTEATTRLHYQALGRKADALNKLGEVIKQPSIIR